MSRWLRVVDRGAQEAALALARGCYQRSLLTGGEALSGSTLRGRAARYAGRYAESRRNLLDRLSAAGVAWSEVRVRRGGRRVLVLGERTVSARAPGARWEGAVLVCGDEVTAARFEAALATVPGLVVHRDRDRLRFSGDLAPDAPDAVFDAIDADPTLPGVAMQEAA